MNHRAFICCSNFVDFFLVQCISIVKRKANCTIEQQKFLFRKWNLIFNPSEIKSLPIDPVFSNWLFHEKIINFLEIQKSLRPSIFSLNRRMRFFQKSSQFFLFFLRSFLFSNYQLALFIIVASVVLFIIFWDFKLFYRIVFFRLNWCLLKNGGLCFRFVSFVPLLI